MNRVRLLEKAKFLMRMLHNEVLKAFLNFQRATEKGSRSSVLRSLELAMAVLTAALVGALHEHAPRWILIVVIFFLSLAAMILFGTFIYCIAAGKEDLIRSESYLIQRYLIEKSFFGDDKVGLMERRENAIRSMPAEEDARDKEDK